MRSPAISLCFIMIAAAQQQPPADPALTLDDRPRFQKGRIEAGVDSGAHSSAATAPTLNTVAPLSAGKNTAELRLRSAQTAQPDSFDSNLALGSFLLETGRAEEAVRYLRRAVQLSPSSIPARHDLSVAYIEAGRLAEAEPLLRKLLTEGSTPAAVHLEARWLAASGKPVEAAEKFQRAAEASPTETHLFDWGNHMLAHGAAEPAGRIFEYAARKYPGSARLKIAQSVSYYAQGNYDRAIELVCEGIRLDPQDLRPLPFLGQMIGVAPKRESELRKELERFSISYPDHAQAQFYYGLSLLAVDEKTKAETYFRKAIQLDPALPQPHLELGKLLAEKDSSPDAVQELETAVRLAPDLGAAHYRLAQLYQRAGQKTRADNHFAIYRKLRTDQAAREEQERRERARLMVTR